LRHKYGVRATNTQVTKDKMLSCKIILYILNHKTKNNIISI
jgi:hypothetical protein